MSVCRSGDNEKTPIMIRDNDNGGSDRFDRKPFRPIQNQGNPGTRNNFVKSVDVDRRRKSGNSKLHRLLIRSPRSPRYDGDGGDSKSMDGSDINPMVSSISERTPPSPSPPHFETPVKQNRYSMMMTMMDHYSYSSSPPSGAPTNTPSTTGSTAFKSRRSHSARSFSTFFSHSDSKDDVLDDNYEEGLGWRCDSDDEGSQLIMSARAPLLSKLLQNELQRNNSGDDQLDNEEYKITSHTLKFAFSWSAWVCVWIFLFALSLSIKTNGYREGSEYSEDRESQWMNWDQIRYASSIFWTVGGDDYPRKDGYLFSKQHRIITCFFMIGSQGFMGLALGKWGDTVMRTYEAALSKKGGGIPNESHAHNFYRVERGRRIFRRHQKPVGNDQERGKHRPRHKSITEHSGSNYGSLSQSSSKNNRHQWHDLNPLAYPDSSDDETEKGLSKDDDDDDGSSIIFPRIHWLLIQSLVLTTLSAICVTTIRYCEKWDAVSTLYYAISTATTAGLKDAFVPVSADGKFFALLFVPLSVLTSLHWTVYIAERRIQEYQRMRYKLKKRVLGGGKRKVLIDERHGFDVETSRKIDFASTRLKLNDQKDLLHEEDYNGYGVKTAACPSISPKTASESTLEKFYELELQRMGLVDPGTFRVLKKKYELQDRVKQRETDEQ